MLGDAIPAIVFQPNDARRVRRLPMVDDAAEHDVLIALPVEISLRKTTWNNVLTMTQQYFIMRRMGVAVGGGTIGGAKTT